MVRKEEIDSNLGNQAVAEEADLPAQIKKIAEHLIFLEKKLDAILAEMKNLKPQGQRFENRNFQKRPGHFRPEGRPGYYQGPGGNQAHSGHAKPHRSSSYPSRYENRPQHGRPTEGNFQKKFSH